MMRVLYASLAYFAIVFGIGFILGMIRVPFVVPAIGERYAELAETPFMLVAIYFSARWTVRRFELRSRLSPAFVCGIVAAGLLVIVEFSVVLWIRGISFSEFLNSRDPIAATAYYFAVAIFALMPGIIATGKEK